MDKFHMLLLFIHLSASQFSHSDERTENILSILHRYLINKEDDDIKNATNTTKHSHEKESNLKQKNKKSINLLKFNNKSFHNESNIATELPWLQRIPRNPVKYRRQYKYPDDYENTYRESSTSAELRDWKEDFEFELHTKKMEAIKELATGNLSKAYKINIAAAMPWGIPCGDPYRHELPWGTCTMPSECDGDLRIYRGDAACDSDSHFVCCAVTNTNHDPYQPLDLSPGITETETSSEEKRAQKRGSKENKRRKRIRQKNRVIRSRFRRKRLIKKKIRRISRQIRKELNRAFRNASDVRRVKTRELKRLIYKLKKKFLMDSKAARDVAENEMKKNDEEAFDVISKVKYFNHDFLMNETFRDMVAGKNTTKTRSLLEAYPELSIYIRTENEQKSIQVPERRFGGGKRIRQKKKSKLKDYLEYDIEYGALYL